jgi:hypothetical protein
LLLRGSKRRADYKQRSQQAGQEPRGEPIHFLHLRATLPKIIHPPDS